MGWLLLYLSGLGMQRLSWAVPLYGEMLQTGMHVMGM
jgi:hypothetical protein